VELEHEQSREEKDHISKDKIVVHGNSGVYLHGNSGVYLMDRFKWPDLRMSQDGEEVGDMENIERMDTKKGSNIEGLT
jgi:hypothetical protein